MCADSGRMVGRPEQVVLVRMQSDVIGPCKRPKTDAPLVAGPRHPTFSAAFSSRITRAPGPSFGRRQKIPFSLKSSDYVNVFPGQDTSLAAIHRGPRIVVLPVEPVVLQEV